MRPLAALALAAALAAPASAKVVRLRVLHTNDIHGWILPRKGRHTARMIGGAAAFAAWADKEREKGPSLTLDAGDWFQGTPEGTLSRGRAAIEVIDAVGYDATTVGNHEFDLGQANLEDLIAHFKTPVLNDNIVSAADGKLVPWVRPWLIKDVGGVKVGLFGVLTTDMPHLEFAKNIDGLRFADEVAAAREAVAELKARGAQVIIMLSHTGQEYPGKPAFVGDQSIAREVPGIDLIVGGHVHIPLDPALRVGSTLIVNTGCYLDKGGEAVLDYDTEAGRVVASTDALTDLWLDRTGEDAAVKKVVERWYDEVGRTLDVVVATAAVDLTRDRSTDSSIGDWMTDCMRDWSKTDLAFQNAGGIRTDIPAGPVERRRLFELMPFDNSLVTLYMKGSDLDTVFEHSVGDAPGMLQLSGAAVRYDPKAPLGHRVRSVTVRGRPLEPDATYSVTAPDFVVQGGDGFSAFSAGTDDAPQGVLVRDVLGWCARREGTLTEPVRGRMTPL